MLVLTRTTNEAVMIGDDIKVTVVEIRGGHVKLGFTCPREIPVHREEVYKAIQADLARQQPFTPQRPRMTT